MGLNIISFAVAAGWLLVMLIGVPTIVLLVLNKYLLYNE